MFHNRSWSERKQNQHLQISSTVSRSSRFKEPNSHFEVVTFMTAEDQEVQKVGNMKHFGEFRNLLLFDICFPMYQIMSCRFNNHKQKSLAELST